MHSIRIKFPFRLRNGEDSDPIKSKTSDICHGLKNTHLDAEEVKSKFIHLIAGPEKGEITGPKKQRFGILQEFFSMGEDD